MPPQIGRFDRVVDQLYLQLVKAIAFDTNRHTSRGTLHEAPLRDFGVEFSNQIVHVVGVGIGLPGKTGFDQTVEFIGVEALLCECLKPHRLLKMERAERTRFCSALNLEKISTVTANFPASRGKRQ